MKEQVLKDKRGKKIGKIIFEKNGKQSLKDERGIKKGVYDPKNNKTVDSRGKKVGNGNLLTTLL